MRQPKKTLAIAAAGALALIAAPAASAAAQGRPDLGREVLGSTDGWAAAEGGTTGGAAATADHVFHVDTWEEFREALGGDDARGDTTARIVHVEGMLDAQARTAGGEVDCDAYLAEGDFEGAPTTYQGFLDAYTQSFEDWVATGADPEEWDPGALDDQRQASNDIQDDQVRQFIGSNVTIVGDGKDAGITGGSLTVRESENVIVRNLHLSDAYDCFPEWDPGDFGGTWNSEFDNLWIATSDHVWIDHNTFDDGDNPPDALPTLLGEKFEVHDGLLDITNGADLITVSWNEFLHHDKTSLVGSTNNPRTPDDPQSDVGELRITFHHNLYEDMGQRTPRLRFGDVHVYNNYYVEPGPDGYVYSWGIGFEGEIYAENNFFELNGIPAEDVVYDWRGTSNGQPNGGALEEYGTLLNGRSPSNRVSLVEAYNAAHEPDIATEVSFEPLLHDRIDPTQSVPARVTAQAGAGRLH